MLRSERRRDQFVSPRFTSVRLIFSVSFHFIPSVMERERKDSHRHEELSLSTVWPLLLWKAKSRSARVKRETRQLCDTSSRRDSVSHLLLLLPLLLFSEVQGLCTSSPLPEDV